MNNKLLIQGSIFDFLSYTLISIFLIFGIISILSLYSISAGEISFIVKKQSLTVGLSLVILLLFSKIPPNTIFKSAHLIYVLSLLLLIITLTLGYKAMGAKRWLNLGFFNIQPSELSKITLIIILAKHFHKCHFNQINTALSIAVAVFYTLLPTLLIIKQPHLGNALLILCISFTIFFLAGVSLKFFITLSIILIASIPMSWSLLHDYQKQRVLTFLNPESDVLGTGYNIIQSVISIGSGGKYGKGILRGTQNQLNFLPENHTDFILALLAEEGGFITIMLILALYLALFFTLFLMGIRCNEQYQRLLISGVASLLFFQTLFNIGMTTGLFPVVGLPLPLLSYGGSNYFIMAMALGMAISAYRESGCR